MKSFGLYMRKTFNEGDEVRDAGLETPEDILRFNDIVYGPDPKWNVMDIYHPADAEGKLPVVISYHGGGWVYGDKDRYQYYCMNIARRGFAVVNFTYRLAPEFQYPAPFEDANLVSEWIMEHAEEYGLDTDHIFGIGDSAGGNIVGIYAAILTNPDYAALYDFRAPEGFSFRAIGTFCGTYRIDLPNDVDEVTMPLITEFLPGRGTAVEMDRLNVFKHMTENFPPVFAASGTGDFLKTQIPPYIEKMLQYNIPFCARYYTSESGELGHDFHCNVRLPQSDECADDLVAFFRKFC